MENSTEKSVFATLIYFSIFDYPLTFSEVCRYLYQCEPSNPSAVSLALENLILENKIKTHSGFYFVNNEKNLVDLLARRKEKCVIADRKFRKVKMVGWFLAVLTFTRLFCVCNTLSYANAEVGSDIDLFIVTRAGKVWTTRFFCLLFLKIFGLRPSPGNSKDKFCLSFFVDESHLDLSPALLSGEDIHFAYWLEQFYPVYDAGGYYAKLRESNSWLKKYLPNAYGVVAVADRKIKLIWLARAIKKFREIFFGANFWEGIFHRLQERALPEQLKAMTNQDTRVVIRDGFLKFHENDRREEYRKKFQNLKTGGIQHFPSPLRGGGRCLRHQAEAEGV